MSILTATVTFAAGLTMPGGYVTDKGHDQGTAILTRSIAFKVFALTNALVQATSTSSVFIHIFMEMHHGVLLLARAYQLMWKATTIVCMSLMMVAYVTGTYAVLDHSSGFAIAYIVISIFLLLIVIVCVEYFSDISVPGIMEPLPLHKVRSLLFQFIRRSIMNMR